MRKSDIALLLFYVLLSAFVAGVAWSLGFFAR